MVWQPEIDELEYRKALAMQMGGEERIERQHSEGKLTVRERIDTLLDPDTFLSMLVEASQSVLKRNLGPKAKYGVRP